MTINRERYINERQTRLIWVFGVRSNKFVYHVEIAYIDRSKEIHPKHQQRQMAVNEA